MNVWSSVESLRSRTPLVQCITNTVASNFAANAVIAVGGSPVMASDPIEGPQITKLASALTVNIGTCTPATIAAIKSCAAVAGDRQLPWVLDPVGVAATKTRQDLCAQLLSEYHPGVVRGNASEIVALATCTGTSYASDELAAGGRGLDSTLDAEQALPGAVALAKKFKCVVALSGACDYVADHYGRVVRIANGDAMMAQVTATGCSLTATLGCFVSDVKADDAKNLFWRVVHALQYYAVAGQRAAVGAQRKTGTMHTHMLDELSGMSQAEFEALARPAIDLSLYLVTDPDLNQGRSTASIVRDAILGGASVVQLREKHCDSGEFLRRAQDVKLVCDEFHVPLIINDRVDIALAVDAAGVHIGQSDLPPDVARQLLGPNKVIGLSVSTEAEMNRLLLYPDASQIVDYIGVGPVYHTNTKPDAKAALGVEGLAGHTKRASHLTVAIGGITESNAQEVLAVHGVRGIAVVTALTMAEDVQKAATKLIRSNQ